MIRHRKYDPYYCLPWGKLELYENLQDCIVREIQEELGFTPVISQLICVHELVRNEKVHLVEFLYAIGNPQDFVMEKTKDASHAHELSEITWIDIADETIIFHPKWLMDILRGWKSNQQAIQVISSA